MTTIYGVYFSHHYTHITNYNLSLMLRVLVSKHINHMPEGRRHIGIIYLYSNLNKSITYLFSSKNYLPFRNLNLEPPEYQADGLPIKLSRLGCNVLSEQIYKEVNYKRIIYFSTKEHYLSKNYGQRKIASQTSSGLRYSSTKRLMIAASCSSTKALQSSSMPSRMSQNPYKIPVI